MNQPNQEFVKNSFEIDEFSIDEVKKKLGIRLPVFAKLFDSSTFQLEATLKYINKLGCKSVSYEHHYIDQDYMEDYSAYYSTTHEHSVNSCLRLNFFLRDRDHVLMRFRAIIEATQTADSKKNLYAHECREFSDEAYLGFMVIKPLGGSPVGRTVLKLPESKDEGIVLSFKPARYYACHLSGIKLSLLGLAFQQQDVGVSACATTAIWSSLQKIKDHEDFSAISPARITKQATQYVLPFGRSMPSEGLSTGQMCQAIHSVGLSPALINVGNKAHFYARDYLHMSIKSGWAPILIIQHKEKAIGHAVTVVGMKIDASKPGHRNKNLPDNVTCDSKYISHIFINDDRLCPYVECEIEEPNAADKEQNLRLIIPDLKASDKTKAKPEKWNVTEILIPTLTAIRLSLPSLKQIVLDLANTASLIVYNSCGKLLTIDVGSRIVKKSAYLEGLVLRNSIKQIALQQITETFNLPRYVASIRLNIKKYGVIDVLVDSTNAARHVGVLGIISDMKKEMDLYNVCGRMAGYYNTKCLYI